HLGLVDVDRLRPGALGAVVDLGWSPAIVGLVERAPVRVDHAGQFLTEPGGYPSDRAWAPRASVREVSRPEQADAAVAEQRRLGARLIKITLHRGAGPVMDLATCQAVVEAAGDLPVVAH